MIEKFTGERRADLIRSTGYSQSALRRTVLKAPFAVAAGAVVLPSALGGLAGAAEAERADTSLRISPRYYPRPRFKPQVVLSGKLAVVTGASRGIGRAIGTTLAALGVSVAGTSRHPNRVPDPPSFPLLELDIADPVSVLGFRAALLAHPTFAQHGHVDILINNAGRLVVGQIIPLPPTDLLIHLAQRDLAFRTIYAGPVAVTNAVLPLLPQQGYARIMFTASIAAYHTGAKLDGGSAFDAYNSAKAALRGYANNLDSALRAAGSGIRVSTVNPYLVNTLLVEHPNPIYTQPVNKAGLSDTDEAFNRGISAFRQLLASALPASQVGEAFAQLLQMTEPDQNVVVASPRQPFAAMGGNSIFEPQLPAENQSSAVPFACGQG
jgi:NAD(P)-dependent dehydrogenase (short-subunit alcohol dehydrogenase family)